MPVNLTVHYKTPLVQVRDLISWMHDTSTVISTVEPARSVSGAEALLAKHSEYKAEIDAREESVTMVTKAGKKLIQQGHYANTEVCIQHQTRDAGSIL